MAKLVVRQPGFFVTIPFVGSFRSPFKVVVPDSLVDSVKTSLLKEGIKNYEFRERTKEDSKPSVSKKKEVEIEGKMEKESVDLSSVLKRLDDIQSLVQKVLQKEPVEKVVVQVGDPSAHPIKKEEEEDMFIPSISKEESTIDLTAKTSEKDDIASRVEALSKLKERRR